MAVHWVRYFSLSPAIGELPPALSLLTNIQCGSTCSMVQRP